MKAESSNMQHEESKINFSKPVDVTEFVAREFPEDDSWWGNGVLEKKSKIIICEIIVDLIH